jgi:yeast amino acid transporter
MTGAIAWCVGETVGELVQVFRVPNAVFEYISAFVDEEIAWGCTFLYWYCWATIFPEEMLSAAAMIRYWNLEPIWPPLIFYLIAPLAMVGINLCPVYVYGWIETVGGIVKSILLFAVSGCMFAVSRHGELVGSLK